MIVARDLSAVAGSFRLRDVSFVVPRGGYGVVIGPAGSGKTTLLEAIGGVRATSGGTLRLGDRDATRLPPERRDVGLVYQHAYLFPHLTVEDNVVYGAPEPAAARELAARLGADGLWSRDVRSLSGGERQLVALTRALARRPAVLLLDEPFAALDPRRRTLARREVRAIHREWGLTVLQVTHDFAEAGLVGDVAVLLDAGRVLQTGPPDEMLRRPASPDVAEFLGVENVFAGTVSIAPPSRTSGDDEANGPDGRGYRTLEFRTTIGGLTLVAVGDAAPGPGYAVIPAEEIVLSLTGAPSSARNAFHGPITDVVRAGALARVTVDIGGMPLVAALTTRSARELALAPGMLVHASFKALAVHLC